MTSSVTVLAVLVNVAAVVLALAALIPSLFLLLQVLSASRGAATARVPQQFPGAKTLRVALLVPAHNEAAGIAATVQALRMELDASDRLLVVADNCDDNTAALARAAGAEVAERHEPARRGKGYALAHGLRVLGASAPPDVVVMVDADCRMSVGGVRTLAAAAFAWQAPVQARYLLRPSGDGGVAQRMAAFAWRIKNLVRPLGSSAWGLPCLLTGSGMAFCWSDLADVPLASGHLVEDMQLGLDLALRGRMPRYCSDVEVFGELAPTPAARASQSRRWVHGHLGVLLSQAPRLAWAAVRKVEVRLAALALDVAVPPLSLLAALCAASVLCAAVVAILGLGALALHLSVLALAAFGIAIGRGWYGYGRDLLRVGELMQLPLYALRRLPLFASFVSRRETRWVRTDRE